LGKVSSESAETSTNTPQPTAPPSTPKQFSLYPDNIYCVSCDFNPMGLAKTKKTHCFFKFYFDSRWNFVSSKFLDEGNTYEFKFEKAVNTDLFTMNTTAKSVLTINDYNITSMIGEYLEELRQESSGSTEYVVAFFSRRVIPSKDHLKWSIAVDPSNHMQYVSAVFEYATEEKLEKLDHHGPVQVETISKVDQAEPKADAKLEESSKQTIKEEVVRTEHMVRETFTNITSQQEAFGSSSSGPFPSSSSSGRFDR
jgi:hypothetical protein